MGGGNHVAFSLRPPWYGSSAGFDFSLGVTRCEVTYALMYYLRVGAMYSNVPGTRMPRR